MTADVILDLRCLQDPEFAQRGIGRHAASLLRHARDTPAIAGCRLIGLLDPKLPELPAGLRALLDGVRHTGYTGALQRPTALVQLSPMTHDPLFVGRLLHHPAVRAAAVVYDFIPLDDPDRYLPGDAARLEYHIALRWLARYDAFLPISADAAGRLRALLGIRADEIHVTGASLDPRFEAAAPASGAIRHLLVIGGSDPRKDPETALLAHAASRAMQAARVPVVVTGAYTPAWLEAQRAAVGAAGGDPGLVHAPGHVDEGALDRLYRDALLVVAPSRAEGFSLPVIEAMASAVPVLASRIPAHRELLLPSHVFDPGDADALAALLDGHVEWRGAALEAQAAVWPRFRAQDVAGRFWTRVAALLPGAAAPAMLRGARPRLAMLTPMPPDRSGIADYSAALCPALGRLVELDVFTGAHHLPCPPGVADLIPFSAVPLLSSEYDRVVHVLGNSHYHAQILDGLLRYGGACIAHDGRLLDFYHGHFGHEHTVRLAEAEMGRPLRPHEIFHWLAGDLPPEALIFAEVAQVAEPLLLHSPDGVDEMARRYGVTAGRLPFCLYRSWEPDALTPLARAAARARLARFGAGPDQKVICTFGFLHANKGPEDCVWALDQLRSWGVDARLHFVGAAHGPMGPVHALIRTLGLQDQVWFAEAFVTEAVWRDHLLGADAAIQLRSAGPGSVSGALSDCIGAGLAAVASRGLARAVDAPGYVVAVPDRPSPLLVAEGLAEVLERGHAGREAEREAYVAAHSFDRYSTMLCQALGL